MIVLLFSICLLAEAIRPGMQTPPKILLPVIGFALLSDLVVALMLLSLALHSLLGSITLIKHFFLFP